MEYGHEIGRRLREVRAWRGVNLRTAADLAGLSYGYLAKIERGERPVKNRQVLESLATALRVAPTELTGQPYPPSDKASNVAHGAMMAVQDALTGWWLGESPDAPVRSWPEIKADLNHLNTRLRPSSDYAAQARLLPTLIRELLAAAAVDSPYRHEALVGLLYAYHSAAQISGRLGFAGLPTVAVERMRQVADALDDPDWSSIAAWLRAQRLSATNRDRQYELAVAVADTGTRTEVRGMANLTAALAAATQGRNDVADTHLAEASVLAESIEQDVSPWAANSIMQFGRANVGIWQVSIGVELGRGAQIAEVASRVRPDAVTPGRQAGYWIDYGRGLLSERRTRDSGLAALLNAEKLAPQQVRNNAFVREAVADQVRRARRDAGGRELRGLAWRMGVAPTG